MQGKRLVFLVGYGSTEVRTANCTIIAQILHFSDCFQGQFGELPLLSVIFNRKLGDSYAIRSKRASERAMFVLLSEIVGLRTFLDMI